MLALTKKCRRKEMDKDTLKAKLNLALIIPTLEDIIEGDPSAAALVAGWNNVIQIQAGNSDDLAVQLQFVGGKLTALPGRSLKPTIVMDFGTPQNLNANFGGGGEKQNPKIKGIWHLFILKKVPSVLKYIAKYLAPRDEDSMSDEAKALRVRVMLRVGVFGIPLIAKLDESAASMAANIPEGSCQWKVKPDGPTMHLVKEKGEFHASKGDMETPSAKVDFKDMPAALGVLTGKKDGMKAMMSGDLAITGQTQIAMMLMPLQAKLGKAMK